MVRKDAHIGHPAVSGSAKGDRSKAWTQLAGLYLEDLPRQLEIVRAAVEGGDFEAVKQLVHRIKGTAGTYHFNTIFKIAGSLEKSAGNCDGDAALEALAEAAVQIEREKTKLHRPADRVDDISEGIADG